MTIIDDENAVDTPDLVIIGCAGDEFSLDHRCPDKPGSLSLDTSRDHVYTEWDSVKRFTEDFCSGVVQQDAGTALS